MYMFAVLGGLSAIEDDGAHLAFTKNGDHLNGIIEHVHWNK